MTIEEQIAETAAQIAPLERRLAKLQREKRKQDSLDFIKVNRITKDDVEMSSGKDKPWFGHISDFVSWLNVNSQKRWAEWNTRIYFQSDLKAGRMPETPAITDDL